VAVREVGLRVSVVPHLPRYVLLLLFHLYLYLTSYLYLSYVLWL